MNRISSLAIFENDPSQLGPQLRRLSIIGNGIFLTSLILTLSAILWNAPRPWGAREGGLIGLVVIQAILCVVFYWAMLHPRWPPAWPWLAAYFLVSLGVWLVEWQLAPNFWWIIWIQLFQLHISLPLLAAAPIAVVLFFVVMQLDPGLGAFFALPTPVIVETVIRWVVYNKLCAFVALLTRSNQERAGLIVELEAARQNLELAHQQELELATLRERERLARDMHDSLGHNLVTMSVQLEAVQRLYPVNPVESSGRIDELKSLIRTSMEALRRTLAGLRASGLDDRPLAQALTELCREIGRRTELRMRCQVDPAVDQLGPAVTEALWRVSQEGLMNIEKHAAARQVQLELSLPPGMVSLRLIDDGVGLPQDVVERPGHYGLRGMRERVEDLGGRLTLQCNDHGGTVLEACVPLIGREVVVNEGERAHEPYSNLIG